MSIFTKTLDKGKKSIIKHKVKKTVNDKLSLNSKHDEMIDKIADKSIEKIGINNILKAKKILDTLKS